MRLRVAHLSNYYRKLERDLEDVRTLQKNMSTDRSYSINLGHSLQEEAERISLLQEKICSQLIKDTPAFLIEELHKGATKTVQVSRSDKQAEPGESEEAGSHGWPQEPVITLPASSLIEGKRFASPMTKDRPQRERSEKKGQIANIEQSISKKSMKSKEEKNHAQKAKKISFPFVFKND